MQLVYKILLGITVFLLLVAGGLVAFYFLKFQPRTMLLLYQSTSPIFSADDANKYAARFGGTWASMSDLKDYMNQGYTTTSAGFLSDTSNTDAGCLAQNGGKINPPTAYYISSGASGSALGNACSAGYYITNAFPGISPPDGWKIMPFVPTTPAPKSWSGFVESLEYVGLSIKNIF